MAATSLHGLPFHRYFRRTVMLVYFSILTVYFDSVYCATLANSSENSSASDFRNDNHENNNTFSHRHLLSPEQILAASNPYIHAPSLGFPMYQNLQPFTPAISYHQVEKASSIKSVPKDPLLSKNQKKRMKVKVKPTNEELANVSAEDVEKVATKTKHSKKVKRKNEKLQTEDNDVEKVESKTVEDDGTERGCPACLGGTCDPFLDTKTNISGIPLIQLLVALAVGAFWAAIFAFILHNFIEYKDGDEGGYGYSPTPEYGAPESSEYGPPHSEYGAPTGYSSNKRITFPTKRYGRSSQGFTFNDMSNWVWDAIDKLITKYETEVQ